MLPSEVDTLRLAMSLLYFLKHLQIYGVASPKNIDNIHGPWLKLNSTTAETSEGTYQRDREGTIEPTRETRRDVHKGSKMHGSLRYVPNRIKSNFKLHQRFQMK